MKVQRKLSATTVVEAEGDTLADVFEKLARMEEVFHGHETCGLCKKSNVAYTVRQDKDNHKYYQATCLDCGGEFRFGVRRQPQGCLFPQYKDNDGNYKPNGGWVNWKEAREPSSNGDGEATQPPCEATINETQAKFLSSICHELAGHDKGKAQAIWDELLARYGVRRWQDIGSQHLNDAADWLRRKKATQPQAGQARPA